MLKIGYLRDKRAKKYFAWDLFYVYMTIDIFSADQLLSTSIVHSEWISYCNRGFIIVLLFHICFRVSVKQNRGLVILLRLLRPLLKVYKF